MIVPQGFTPSSYDNSLGPLAGVPTAQLQAWLATAQAAWVEFQTGAKIVEATYVQGDGQKTVKYQAANLASLMSLIYTLQAALGNASSAPRRRPIKPMYMG